MTTSSHQIDRRWCIHPWRPPSEAEIDRANYELIREMRAAGLSWPAIGGELGQRNWTAVYQRFQRLERRFGHGRPDSNEPPTTPSRDG